MTKPKRQKTPFEIWWRANKWKGVQWYPIFVAEDAYKAGYRAGRKKKA